MDKQPGTTRLSFLIIIAALLVLSTPVIVYTIKADIATLVDIVKVAIGAIIGVTGTVTAHYFGGK